MFAILRKIKKSLIESASAKALAKEGDSARKYLCYAIGENVLVMIGILLALQVNNWNENRLNHKKEHALLSSIN